MRIRFLPASVVASAAALLLISGAAQAHHDWPCKDDIQKFCPDAKPGGGGVRACLQQNASNLSAACQEHLSQMQSHVDQLKQACEGDVQKFCNPQAGPAEKFGCLRDHRADLSQACQDQLAQARKHWHHRHMHNPDATPGSSDSSGS